MRNGLPVPMSQKFPEKSPVAPSCGQKPALWKGGGGLSIVPPPPGQNLTNGVNRSGPKGSQLGDPTPTPTANVCRWCWGIPGPTLTTSTGCSRSCHGSVCCWTTSGPRKALRSWFLVAFLAPLAPCVPPLLHPYWLETGLRWPKKVRLTLPKGQVPLLKFSNFDHFCPSCWLSVGGGWWLLVGERGYPSAGDQGADRTRFG